MRVSVSHTPPSTTKGFDTYWKFAAKRQKIYMDRLAAERQKVNPTQSAAKRQQIYLNPSTATQKNTMNGSSAAQKSTKPNGSSDRSTVDTVIATHRFTNAYRAADRVSQYLIKSVQYNPEWDWSDTFVRTLVFKVFNRISTWEHLVEDIGEPNYDSLFNHDIDQSLERLAGKQPIYSAAYIMPPPRSTEGPKYVRHLTLLRTMIKDGVHLEIKKADSMKSAFLVLRRYESIGDFLAYQFIIDLNYSSHLDFSEQEFVVPGPGSLRGLRKCFSDPKGRSAVDLLKWTSDQQDTEFDLRSLHWEGLWGRELQLIDIQNLFCEVDKYTRVALPELAQYASGTRIKQLYRPNPSPLTAWFPPKWEINDLIESQYSHAP